MRFVGQVDMGEIEQGGGPMYAFWCADCGMAGTDYQQT
jgi:hypothetical protein